MHQEEPPAFTEGSWFRCESPVRYRETTWPLYSPP